MLLNLSHIKPFIIWLQLHPEVAAAVTFGISFVECLAVIGLVVPGTVIMTAIGALIGSVMIPAGSTILAAVLGAIAGDVISFWLGSHFHDRVPQMWPFRTHSKLLTKGKIGRIGPRNRPKNTPVPPCFSKKSCPFFNNLE